MAEMARRFQVWWVILLAVWSCSPKPQTAPEDRADSPGPLPSVLLVTLDTTRADALGFENDRVETPALVALADRGVRFTHAYTTVPTTLPSHTSIFTGLYPTDHGIRENGRRVSGQLELLAPNLARQGFQTAAIVSGYPLASEFGLARGFDHYDDDFGDGRTERTAGETTERALTLLAEATDEPLFLWVHYFDPHDPYEPPEPWAGRYAESPYLGEVAYLDSEVGRLLAAFETRAASRPWKILVVGDHGEGLGDHGEALHGNLLYQGAMRVPLIFAGSEIEPGVVESAVSVRQIFATILGWAGDEAAGGLFVERAEPVLAEALKPYLQYGWQPQFMVVQDGIKVIRSAETEIYDLRTDPEEVRNLAGEIDLDPVLRQAISSYAERALETMDPAAAELTTEAREKLASLGYFCSDGGPAPVRQGAPNPRDMVHLYRDLDLGAGLFIRRDYEQAIQVFSRVAAEDPYNFMVALRLAVAHSTVGNQREAMELFARAREIKPSSIDLRHYQAMHHLRYGQDDLALPLFETVIAQMPDRVSALRALAQIYTRQGRIEDATRMLERVVELEESPGLELARLGELRMSAGDTAGAIRALEKAQTILGEEFTYHLELGVVYLANRQLAQAAASLDRVSAAHPGYPMALFKRAQVSVLLAEADREERVRAAWDHADQATRPLIENEQLFRDIAFR